MAAATVDLDISKFRKRLVDYAFCLSRIFEVALAFAGSTLPSVGYFF